MDKATIDPSIFTEAGVDASAKTCSDCGYTKPLVEFCKKGHGRYRSCCKPCDNRNRRNERSRHSKRWDVENVVVEVAVEEEQCSEWAATLLSLMKDRGMIGRNDHDSGEIDVDILLKRTSPLAEFLT